MAEFKIDAKKREIRGKKVKNLRNEGFVPATIYGPHMDPISIQFPYRSLELALMDAGGTNLIDITVDGTAFPSLARDVQRDVIRKEILHVDFLAVDMSETIQADIPIVFLNESPVVAARQGILITGTNTVTIEVLPADLINQIEVDLSVLAEIGDGITVADLTFAEGTTVINDPEDMIAKVLQPSAARAEELDAMLGEGEEAEGEEAEGEEAVESEEESEEE